MISAFLFYSTATVVQAIEIDAPMPPRSILFSCIWVRFPLSQVLIRLLRWQTDPLSALLTKYVSPERRPRRDVTGEYQGRDVHEMVVSYLHKLSLFLPLRPRFTFASFSRLSRTFSQRLHLSHTHPHYTVVSRICTRSFIILLSLSVLLSVRVHRFRFPRDWRVFSVLYSPSASVAKYY
jgi:hypothetical protein